VDTSDELEQEFARLKSSVYTVTSPKDGYYNCVAHAMKCDFALWWPIDRAPYYWPVQPRINSLDGFVRAFRECGFELCADGSFEEESVKIAIFVYLEDELPSHLAIQDFESCSWSSKCGDKQDILHDLSALCGPKPAYGKIERYMKCPIGKQKECDC
jgi:hypothetical protein